MNSVTPDSEFHILATHLSKNVDNYLPLKTRYDIEFTSNFDIVLSVYSCIRMLRGTGTVDILFSTIVITLVQF